MRHYRDKILNACPWVSEIKVALQFLADHLKEATPQNLTPPEDESLFNWLTRAKRNEAKKLPITLVVGESRGKHRLNRSEREHNDGRATTAGTVDAMGGVRVVMALLRDADIELKNVDCHAVLDEWMQPQATTQSHLVVVGSGEVNLYALFLNGLVQDYRFGENPDEPDPLAMGDVPYVGEKPCRRSPRGGSVDHVGGIVLLRNPWNPKFRTLWVAGLTGRATLAGCNLIDESWRGIIDLSKKSIGLVYTAQEVRETLVASPLGHHTCHDTGSACTGPGSPG